ncbi:cell wall degrading peptidase [Bordetella trematum]|uniref:Cell wall degrading peptidase n=1 Tax=Bordetella trematum TaxID=123899 RepID=A0A157RM75_9BORD|nr:cell wall degrading peptidase [Bordetella trematum]SAI70222.1 cell wall degrading peptidase [Bordetella trematum]SUV98893.1 cell wall degrading peptidase [Bordetella trematum]
MFQEVYGAARGEGGRAWRARKPMQFLVRLWTVAFLTLCPTVLPRFCAILLSRARLWLVVSLLAVLAGCASSGGGAKPGYHRVQSGETLTSIARKYKQNVNDLVRWNNLPSANRINKGQLLRVQRPDGTGSAAAGAQPAKPAVTRAAPAVKSAPVTGIRLVWPAAGTVTRRFNGSSSQGLTIANSAGTPVVAAADGDVAYAASGLRGYGNLVIVRHGSAFLTIYAHNRKLLVKPGQRVRQGQKIAEMGDSDANTNQLYFELRRNGKPVDPSGVLPAR